MREKNDAGETFLDVAILLIGFNRLDLVERRIQEVWQNKSNLQLYISIDGGSSEIDSSKFEKSIQSATQNWDKPPVIRIHESNLGLVRHLISQIDSILMFHKAVIVIEDDIYLSENFIASMKLGLLYSQEKTNILNIGGFSPLSSSFKRGLPNYWRTSNYFSAWGWAITSEKWSLYRNFLNGNLPLSILRRSKSFNSMSKNQRVEWLSRFAKVKNNPWFTWDYQMQFAHFALDMCTLRPVFRLTDNEGFDDKRSTNTKASRPLWMGKLTVSPKFPSKQIEISLVSRFFQRIDSVTIGGYSHPARLIRRLLLWLRIRQINE